MHLAELTEQWRLLQLRVNELERQIALCEPRPEAGWPGSGGDRQGLQAQLAAQRAQADQLLDRFLAAKRSSRQRLRQAGLPDWQLSR